MNKLIIILTLLFSTSSFAKDFLTESQGQTVLTSIDNICGNTWCEGDFDFSFDEVICDSKTSSCKITMDLINMDACYDDNGDSIEGCIPARHTGSCTISGVSSFHDIIDAELDYEQLAWKFYENLTDCISDLESDARHILDY